MKKLLLLSTLLIFACSSDESSDTNDNNNNSSTKKIISIQVVEDVDNICLDGSNFTFSYSGDDITSLTRQYWGSPCPNSNETSWTYSTSMVTNYIYLSNKIVVSSEFDYYDGFEYYFDDNGLLTTISFTNSGEVYDDVIFQNGKLLALSGIISFGSTTTLFKLVMVLLCLTTIQTSIIKLISLPKFLTETEILTLGLKYL